MILDAILRTSDIRFALDSVGTTIGERGRGGVIILIRSGASFCEFSEIVRPEGPIDPCAVSVLSNIDLSKWFFLSLVSTARRHGLWGMLGKLIDCGVLKNPSLAKYGFTRRLFLPVWPDMG